MSATTVHGKVDIVRQDVLDALDAQPGARVRSTVGLVLITMAIVVVVQSTPPDADLPWLVIGILILAPIGARFGKGMIAARLHSAMPESERAQSFQVGPDGVVIQSQSSRSQVTWSEVQRWREGTRTFLVYTDSRRFLILPKRAFERGDVPAIRALLQQVS